VPAALVVHRHGASTRLGSRQFHLWNERNRLAMLIRCAPAPLAAREVARFAALTALLPLRQLRRKVSGGHVSNGNSSTTAPWNFRVELRLQVLYELLATLGPLLRERRTITRLANVPRSMVWHQCRSTNSAS
jgi:hypothetical protein